MAYACSTIEISRLETNPRNARTHDARQIARICASIVEFGFTNPLLVDERRRIIAGHGRLSAALRLGMTEVPVIVVTGLSDPQRRALALADNRIALNAGWDADLLAEELGELAEMGLDFDLEITGFETAEIDMILEGGDAPGDADAPPDAVAGPDRDAPPVTRPGDLWRLGRHRLLCGNARSASDHARLMAGRTADAVFTDPPYNVPIDGHVCGQGRIRHRAFAEASGEMTPADFTAFLEATLGAAATHMRAGAVAFVCMDWRHLGELLQAGQRSFGPLLNLCVWAKTNAGMGALYRSQHELVFVFRRGATQHRNNVRLGRFGRNRTNVWTYAGVNTFRPGRMEELAAHPTAKPVAMIRDALLDVTRRGDLVLDPFLGSGATLIAAERSGRVACGLELDPAYVDVALRRWHRETGAQPVRESDGASLDDLAPRTPGESPA